MLILVAVTVRTVVQSGLFGHASKATSGYSMHEAREQLGTTLAGAQAEKYTNKDYTENDYLNQYIKDNLPNTKIEGDIVIVDGWAFELDRSVPKIGQDLGKEGTFTYPDLKLEKGLVAEDNLSIPIKITAREAENGISKIEVILNGKVIKTFEDCNNNTEELTRTYTATENGNYSVKVYSKINRTGYITIDDIVPPTPQIGDYVRYTPDTAGAYSVPTTSGYSAQSINQDTGLKWKVLSMNSDGTIDLVADRAISSTVYFGGALGYNNGVYLLDDLCRAQYSNSTLGVTSRSLDLVDIEKHFTDSGRAARDAYTFGGVQYGSTKTYSGNYSYAPHVWNNNDKNVSKASNNIAELESNPLSLTTETYSQLGNITVTQTGYNITSQASYYDDPNFHNLIFGTGTTYWLASRCARCYSTVASFGLRNVDGGNFDWNALFNSNGGTFNPCYAVRPVVSLASTVKLEQVAGNDNTWNIVKK